MKSLLTVAATGHEQWTVGRDGVRFGVVKARIRELIRATPFQPFIIRMTDGRQYRVDHPDFVLASSNDVSQVIIEEPDNRMHFLSALLMTSIEQASGTNQATPSLS